MKVQFLGICKNKSNNKQKEYLIKCHQQTNTHREKHRDEMRESICENERGENRGNPLVYACDDGTWRSLLRPMTAVGVKAKDRKWPKGNQYHIWQNMATPTMDANFLWPLVDRRPSVALRPPASKMPAARTAPILLIVSPPRLAA